MMTNILFRLSHHKMSLKTKASSADTRPVSSQKGRKLVQVTYPAKPTSNQRPVLAESRSPPISSTLPKPTISTKEKQQNKGHSFSLIDLNMGLMLDEIETKLMLLQDSDSDNDSVSTSNSGQENRESLHRHRIHQRFHSYCTSARPGMDTDEARRAVWTIQVSRTSLPIGNDMGTICFRLQEQNKSAGSLVLYDSEILESVQAILESIGAGVTVTFAVIHVNVDRVLESTVAFSQDFILKHLQQLLGHSGDFAAVYLNNNHHPPHLHAESYSQRQARDRGVSPLLQNQPATCIRSLHHAKERWVPAPYL
jgi:hypothetical protein